MQRHPRIRKHSPDRGYISKVKICFNRSVLPCHPFRINALRVPRGIVPSEPTLPVRSLYACSVTVQVTWQHHSPQATSWRYKDNGATEVRLHNWLNLHAARTFDAAPRGRKYGQGYRMYFTAKLGHDLRANPGVGKEFQEYGMFFSPIYYMGLSCPVIQGLEACLQFGDHPPGRGSVFNGLFRLAGSK